LNEFRREISDPNFPSILLKLNQKCGIYHFSQNIAKTR